MFSLDNVRKLFSYNWNLIIRELIPNGKKVKISDESYKNIRNGSILRIVASILIEALVIGLVIYTFYQSYSWLFSGSDLIKYALKNMKDTLDYVALLKSLLTLAWLPILLLVYIHVTKEKEQSTWPFFLALIVSFAQFILCLDDIWGWITYIVVSPMFAIIGLSTYLLYFFGTVDIAVGCIDFCKSISTESTLQSSVNDYSESNYTNQVQSNVGVTQPSYMNQQLNNNGMVNNQQAGMATGMPQNRQCPHCGNEVNINMDTCFMCGNKL